MTTTASFDRNTHTLSGYRSGNAFRLGDRLRVAVARVDLERRELDFRLVQRKKRAAPQSKPDKPSTAVKRRKKVGRKAAVSKSRRRR